MFNEGNQTAFYIIALLVAVLVIIFGVFVFNPHSSEITLKQDNTNYDHTINVTGNAEQKILPDEAYIYFTIDTNALSAQAAQEQNAKIWDEVKKELDKKDFAKYSTESYNVYPDMQWDKNGEHYITVGYKVSHSVRVTLTKIDEAGAILDMVVNKNVSNVDSVSFGLSNKLQKTTKEGLWKDAVEDAKARAKTVVSATGSTLIDTPKSISLNEYNYTPVYRTYNTKEMAMDSVAGSAPQTDVTPRELTVSVSLNLVYEYN